MTSVLGTLRTNIRLFPRLATLIGVVYAVVGLLLALTCGIRTAVTSIVIVVLIDIITFMVIRANPVLFYRCQRAADALVNYPRSNEGEPEPDEESMYEEEDEIEEDVEVEEEPKEEGEEPRQ